MWLGSFVSNETNLCCSKCLESSCTRFGVQTAPLTAVDWGEAGFPRVTFALMRACLIGSNLASYSALVSNSFLRLERLSRQGKPRCEDRKLIEYDEHDPQQTTVN